MKNIYLHHTYCNTNLWILQSSAAINLLIKLVFKAANKNIWKLIFKSVTLIRKKLLQMAILRKLIVRWIKKSTELMRILVGTDKQFAWIIYCYFVLSNTKGKRIFSVGENDAARATFLDNAANGKVRLVVARSIDIDVLVSRYFPREWWNEKWCIGVQNLVERFFEEPLSPLTLWWVCVTELIGNRSTGTEKVGKDRWMRQVSKRMVSGVLHMK